MAVYYFLTVNVIVGSDVMRFNCVHIFLFSDT